MSWRVRAWELACDVFARLGWGRLYQWAGGRLFRAVDRDRRGVCGASPPPWAPPGGRTWRCSREPGHPGAHYFTEADW